MIDFPFAFRAHENSPVRVNDVRLDTHSDTMPRRSAIVKDRHAVKFRGRNPFALESRGHEPRQAAKDQDPDPAKIALSRLGGLQSPAAVVRIAKLPNGTRFSSKCV